MYFSLGALLLLLVSSAIAFIGTRAKIINTIVARAKIFDFK